MNSTYILQKDLPDSKAGDKYIWNGRYEKYYKNGDITDSYWGKESVEDNEEWFKLDQVTVILSATSDCKTFTIRINDKYYTVNIDQKYTEEDMRKCFYAPIYFKEGLRFDDFEEYLKTLKK